MTLREVDDALRQWRERLNAAAQNLMDLQSHPVYQRISSPDAKLSGETAKKSALAVGTLGRLLQYFELLQDTVRKAEDLRRETPSIFGVDEHLQQIVRVLTGASIQMPAQQFPLEQRSLLGGIESVDRVAPAQLLSVMETAFENTKGIVLELDRAWESIGSCLDSCAQRVERLSTLSEELTENDRRELEKAQSQISEAQRHASEDPLACFAPAIDDLLRAMEQRLQQARHDRQQVRSELAKARAALEELRKSQQAAQPVLQEAREKTGLVSQTEHIEPLAQWLDRIEQGCATTPSASILIGLRNWTRAAGELAQQQQQQSTQARNQLARRSELRGRFDALKAKARAYKLAEDDDLLRIAREADRLLYTRPTPLDQAEERLRDYERQLNIQASKIV